MTPYKAAGFIPFKANSERVPGKNLRLLGKKRLFEHVLDAALASDLDVIYITTDSEEVNKELKERKNPRVKLLEEPPEDEGGIIGRGDVLLNYALEKVDAQIYVQLFVTAPFLRTETINESIKILQEDKYDSVFTVNKKFDWVWYNGKPITYFPGNLPRSQDAIPLMVETTGLYAMQKKALKEYRRRVGNRPYMLEVDQIEGLDIDYEQDFLMATLIEENLDKLEKIMDKKYH